MCGNTHRPEAPFSDERVVVDTNYDGSIGGGVRIARPNRETGGVEGCGRWGLGHGVVGWQVEGSVVGGWW